MTRQQVSQKKGEGEGVPVLQRVSAALLKFIQPIRAPADQAGPAATGKQPDRDPAREQLASFNQDQKRGSADHPEPNGAAPEPKSSPPKLELVKNEPEKPMAAPVQPSPGLTSAFIGLMETLHGTQRSLLSRLGPSRYREAQRAQKTSVGKRGTIVDDDVS